MGIEEPTLVGLLRRLETDGWIKRRDASHDRRCKNVRLARKTSPVLHEIFDTAQQLRHQLLADISKRDLQTCMRVLTRIHEKAETKDNRNGNKRRVSNRKR
jgi:MarR family transcriptional regulator for hemolysin